MGKPPARPSMAWPGQKYHGVIPSPPRREGHCITSAVLLQFSWISSPESQFFQAIFIAGGCHVLLQLYAAELLISKSGNPVFVADEGKHKENKWGRALWLGAKLCFWDWFSHGVTGWHISSSILFLGWGHDQPHTGQISQEKEMFLKLFKMQILEKLSFSWKRNCRKLKLVASSFCST